MDFNKGDIIECQETIHPIIFLGDISFDQFYGCMITHAGPRYNTNIAMNESHFKRVDNHNVPFIIQFDNSYLARIKLIKESNWGPYTKGGELTVEGLDFVLYNLRQNQPTTWKRYISKLRR